VLAEFPHARGTAQQRAGRREPPGA